MEHNDLVITQISTTIETSDKRSVTLEMNEWYTIREGKIVALVVYFDTALLTSRKKEHYANFENPVQVEK